jgi:Leucine-rich repeat (LRR) protein
LKQINLSKNNLTKLSRELCQIKQLDHLDLSFNKITQIEDFVADLNCIELNLNDNRIKAISENISKCTRLKVLRLEQNCLELAAIPVTLLTDSKVALLSLDGNLFTQKQFELMNGYEKV